MSKLPAKIYFSDFFQIDSKIIEDYGAPDISLISDLPLFIDPFLIFNSSKPEYKRLHSEIIKYLSFLKDKSIHGEIDKGLLKAWFTFPEIYQIWIGYSVAGSKGNGLGRDFANALNDNLYRIFNNFGNEQITKSSHLEKLCLIEKGVGKDHISDFAANLIKEYLLEYTQTFARKYLKSDFKKKFTVKKVRFNYKTQVWESDSFELPVHNGDYVLLTPRDILTRDEIWINKEDLIKKFDDIPEAITNEELRAQVTNYFLSQLPKSPPKKEPTKKEVAEATINTIRQFPVIIDYYIKNKEARGDRAVSISSEKVANTEEIFIHKVKESVAIIQNETEFYKIAGNTYEETMQKILFLKDCIENKDVYKNFYDKKGQPIKREENLKLVFKLMWYGTPSDVNAEVNNGRGYVDFKISRGRVDSTVVEFKLASNSKLKQNLAKQLEIYKKANNTEQGIKVIMYFSEEEYQKVKKVVRELDMTDDKNIILINARKDDKISASNVKI